MLDSIKQLFIDYDLLIRSVFCLILIISVILVQKSIKSYLIMFILKVSKVQLKDKQKEDLVNWFKSFEWLFFIIALDISKLIMINYLPLFIIKLDFKLIYIIYFGFISTRILDYVRVDVLKTTKFDALDTTMAYMVLKVAKVIVWLIIIAMFLQQVGYDVSTLVAGLGIGGLAFALAAQDAVSNLFGCFVILLDKPFKINDWIKTNDLEGIVEGITFRSTRIRTFQNALLCVPNSTLANSLITNYSQMEKRKLISTVTLTYSTSSDVIKKISEELKQFLNGLSFVENNSAGVHLDELNSSSIDLRIDATILRKGLMDFLNAKEEINYGIISIVEKNGGSFAFPSQSIYIETMPSKD